MAGYPSDPNHLIRDTIALNARIRTLREEGWLVKVGAAENGTRVYVEISTVRSCDPPAKEPEQ